MRPWVQWAASLYPARWRARYGRELEALIEDAEPGWRDVWDVIAAALEMQMATSSIAKSAAVVAVAGALIGAGLTLRMPHRYVATGEVRVASHLHGQLPGLEREVLSRTFLSAVIQKEDLYKADRRSIPLEDVVNRMRSEYIHVAQTGATGDLQVSFTDEDPARAQRVTHWIVNQMAYVLPAALHVAAPPDLPRTPVPPARMPAIGYGLGAGLLVGAFAAWLWRQPRRWTFRMAGFVFGGAVLGFALMAGWWFDVGPSAWLVWDHYNSETTLRAANIDGLKGKIGSAETLRTVIRESQLYRSATDLNQAVDLVRRDLRIWILPSFGSQLVSVSFTYTDRYKAQRALYSLIGVLQEKGTVEVIDLPYVAERGRIRDWYFLVFGILLGLGAGLIRIRRRPSPTLQPA